MNFLKNTLKAGLFVLPLFVATGLSAQKINQASSAVKVTGTSTAHDWEMNATGATFTGVVNGDAITNVTLVVPVKNLKSGKSMMDNKTYDALKASKSPNVTFTASSINVGKSNVSGKLSIAGVTKTVSFPVSVVKKGDSYVIDGTETVKLSEFGMDRPGMLGMKTGDVVTVKVNVVAK